jgi:hypothetical protein
MIRDLQPISICEDEGFVELIKRAWPHYKMPCRQTFTTKIEKLYLDYVVLLRDKLSQAKHVAITSDGYSQKYTQRQFDTISVHYLSKNHTLESAVLDLVHVNAVSHTGEVIQDILRIILDKYDLKSKPFDRTNSF